MRQEGSSLNYPISATPTIADADEHAECKTRQEQAGMSESPIIINQTTSLMNNYHKTLTKQNEEWYYPPGGGSRQRILCCGDCGYKAVHSNLVKHARRMHPSSSSALPPTIHSMTSLIHQCTECEYATKKKGDLDHHLVFHREKSALQCPWCSFSSGVACRLTNHLNKYHTKLEKKALACEKQENSVPKKREEEWYYFDGGKKRIRYKFCGYCVYKTTNRWSLDLHVKLVHPLATTALQHLITMKEEKSKFHCALCPFKTNLQSNFERHITCHRKLPAKHQQCHLCSFSVNNRGNLALHLEKFHHRKMDEKKNNSNVKQMSNKNTEFSRNGAHRRFLLLTCRDCNDFKTASRFILKRHIKRAHPFSRLLPLQPLPNQHKKTLHSLRKSRLEITEENHRLVDDASHPASEETREEWYVSPSGERKRYIYCTECDYRTVTPSSIINHAGKNHGLSTLMVPAHSPKEAPQMELKKKKITLLKCLECDFSTRFKGDMNGHKQSHQRNGKFKCYYCSFSSDFRCSIVLHFRHGHHRNLVPLGTPARIQEVQLEAINKTVWHQRMPCYTS